MGDPDLFFEVDNDGATHAALVLRGVRWALGAGKYRSAWAEIVSAMPVIPDVFAISPRGSLQIEVKVSRSDFRRDRQKISGRHPGYSIGDHKYYLVPSGLIAAEEVPEGWGLLWCSARQIRVVVPAPVRVETPSETILRLRTERAILASIARRHELGVAWHRDTGRFDAYNASSDEEDRP